MSSNIFFTSDNHFNHRRILEYCPARGQKWTSREEMNEGLKENWNKTVPPDAIVHMLGDVCFWYKPEPLIEYMSQLNGKKHLVLGNHDHMIIENRELLLKEGVFESIRDYREIKMEGEKERVVLFHFSPRIWNRAHKGSMCLWGHSHGGLEPYGRSVDVGIDSPWVTGKIEHRPFTWEEIKTFMNGRELTKHHEVDNDQ